MEANIGAARPGVGRQKTCEIGACVTFGGLGRVHPWQSVKSNEPKPLLMRIQMISVHLALPAMQNMQLWLRSRDLFSESGAVATAGGEIAAGDGLERRCPACVWAPPTGGHKVCFGPQMAFRQRAPQYISRMPRKFAGNTSAAGFPKGRAKNL